MPTAHPTYPEIAVAAGLPRTETFGGRPRAAVCVDSDHRHLVYPAEEMARASKHVEILNPDTDLDRDQWPVVEIILGGWGMPVLDENFMRRAPRLEAVFYAAGSVRGFMTEAAWARGLTVTAAAQPNSEVTAEFCLSLVIFSLKHGWLLLRRPAGEWRDPHKMQKIPGLYGSRVGLVSFGRVARRLASLLRHLPVEIVCWDPLVSDEDFRSAGVKPCGLEELFSTSHVVSLHTPLLRETEHLVDADLLALLPPGATVVNTSRGAIIDEEALIALLRRRTDLQAVLDVTREEPLASDSPLWSMPNVVLTPHIAGACGPECRRLGACAVDELIRYLDGQPLRHALTREAAARLA
jgi:phosphoglycerate dehydrogenase-like enzyme